jgi:hypothetical protein
MQRKYKNEPLSQIDSLIQDLKTLQYGEDAKLDATLRRAEVLIREVFGADSRYLGDLRRIRFHSYSLPTSREYQEELWRLGTEQVLRLFEAMREEMWLLQTS